MQFYPLGKLIFLNFLDSPQRAWPLFEKNLRGESPCPGTSLVPLHFGQSERGFPRAR